MRLKKIRQLMVPVRNLDETVAFYRDKLGAKLIARYDPPGMAFFDFDGVRILFEKGEPHAGPIYFWVDDIDASYAEMQANGITFEDQPHMIFKDDAGTFGTAGQGEWMCFFKDPSGNLLALASRK